jgi:glycopeptide antibiotics resistance protein
MKKKILIISIILYSVLILKLIVFKYPPGITFSIADANLTPFKTILGYLIGEPTWRIAARNLLGNIVVLVPFGFLFAALYQKIKWSRVLLVGLFVGAILELLQVIFRSGIPDIDDIILNSFGVVIGYLIFIFLYEVFKKNHKKG